MISSRRELNEGPALVLCNDCIMSPREIRYSEWSGLFSWLTSANDFIFVAASGLHLGYMDGGLGYQILGGFETIRFEPQAKRKKREPWGNSYHYIKYIF